MFTTIKKLFGRRSEPAADTAAQRSFDPSLPKARPAAPAPVPAAARSTRVEHPAPAPLPAGAKSSTFALPLKAVLARLQPDLMQRVRQMEVGEAEIFLPMQKVLAQIVTGSVKLSFGELRQLAPPGTFTSENDRDRTLIELPLQEILPRLNPAYLPRRQTQRRIEVPSEVVGPFGGQNKVVISTAPLKAGSQAAIPIEQPAPFQPVSRPQTAAPVRAPIPTAQPIPRPAQPAPQYFAPQPEPEPELEPELEAEAEATPEPEEPAPTFAPPLLSPRSPIRMQPTQSPSPMQPQGMPIAARLRQPQAAPAAPANIPAPRPYSAIPAARTAAPIAPQAPRAPIAPSRPAAPLAPPAANPYKAPQAFAPGADEGDDDQPIFKHAKPGAGSRPPTPPPAAPISGDTDVIPMASIQRHSGLKAAPISPIAPEPEPEPEPIRFSEPPPAAEPVLPPVPVETNFIPVSLSDLAQAWPDAIRQEIHSRNIGHMQVGLPFGAVEGAIKQGKVSFPWKAVRSWIKPPLPPSNSPLDTAMLELPLRVVTPLFMAELKATRSQRSRVAIDKEIPDLFYGAGGAPEPAAPVAPIAPLKPQFPTPSATTLGLPNSAGPAHPPGHGPLTQRPGPGISPEAAKAAKLADTNYYTWKDDNDEVDGSEVFTKKGENSPGTAFLNRYATPNDIVGKAAGLKGVDGALIALPDGLLVASRIPPNMNADTIAAFLPQIFSRVSQSTRELRLGELNNLNFTVGNIPWKIFRVGSIYFAVFGRPGEPLPTSQLVSLAAELDRKAK